MFQTILVLCNPIYNFPHFSFFKAVFLSLPLISYKKIIFFCVSDYWSILFFKKCLKLPSWRCHVEPSFLFIFSVILQSFDKLFIFTCITFYLCSNVSLVFSDALSLFGVFLGATSRLLRSDYYLFCCIWIVSRLQGCAISDLSFAYYVPSKQ